MGPKFNAVKTYTDGANAEDDLADGADPMNSRKPLKTSGGATSPPFFIGLRPTGFRKEQCEG